MRFKLAHVRVGKLLRVKAEVLEKWIARGGTDFDHRPRAVSPEQEIAEPREPKVRSPKSGLIAARISTALSKRASTITITPRRGHGRNSEVLVTQPDGTQRWISRAQGKAKQAKSPTKDPGAAQSREATPERE